MKGLILIAALLALLGCEDYRNVCHEGKLYACPAGSRNDCSLLYETVSNIKTINCITRPKRTKE